MPYCHHRRRPHPFLSWPFPSGTISRPPLELRMMTNIGWIMGGYCFPAWVRNDRNKWSINCSDESSDPFQGFTSKAQKDMGFSPTYSTLCHIFSTYSIVVEHKMHYTNVHSKSWHNCSVTSSFYQLNLELQQVETIKKPDSFHLICIAGMKI